MEKLQKKQMIKRACISIALSVIFLFSLLCGTSCFGEELEITNTRMEVEHSEYLGYSATIEGVAKNVSGRNLSYAQIEFTVYDASGNNLGTALANINNLLEGDTWVFEAMLLSFPSTRPASYKLVAISCY